LTDPIVCAKAAPIIRYMVGWELGEVERYAARHGWRLEWVDNDSEVLAR